LAFRDTLICSVDSVQLQASGSGLFNWTPLSNITSSNTATPIVSPNTTTYYYVNLDDNGCRNRDSVKVRVVDFVTLKANADTTICQGDPAQLGAATDGLRFLWAPPATLNDATMLNAIATPLTTTTFQLTSYIGSCNATDDLTIKVVPYPITDAGNDTTICYKTQAQLHGSIVGSSFSWSPTFTLINSNTLNPIAIPVSTTAYILSARDVLGCPKPGRDTVIVIMLPEVKAFAGNDTAVVVGQPLQLQATGGLNYVWSPPSYLDDKNISDPIATFPSEIDSVKYLVIVTDQAGCFDSAFINVKVFKTNPSIFVPTAFTPNGDGKNDVIRPVAVGMKTIEYFRIYNRWGQLVFSTTINGHGWDGTIGGRLQGTNAYAWIVKGIDYLDRPFFQKGTVTLIR
ncbi:MAG: gliding motility-associated C-terminal domain-containing protein, partial [Bacteroidota bacterium]|nr:gliding motility-associated C-terminal domain-containing protein [Bacteroidota bacterium]